MQEATLLINAIKQLDNEIKNAIYTKTQLELLDRRENLIQCLLQLKF